MVESVFGCFCCLLCFEWYVVKCFVVCGTKLGISHTEEETNIFEYSAGCFIYSELNEIEVINAVLVP